MFWVASHQIVQMMMHHLHDLVAIFCFLSILVKKVAYIQCKTAKPVSKHAHFVTDTRTNIMKFEGHLHKRPFGQQWFYKVFGQKKLFTFPHRLLENDCRGGGI